MFRFNVRSGAAAIQIGRLSRRQGSSVATALVARRSVGFLVLTFVILSLSRMMCPPHVTGRCRRPGSKPRFDPYLTLRSATARFDGVVITLLRSSLTGGVTPTC